jgi:DNA-binding NtrC family response regulator
MQFGQSALERMRDYAWPGNLTELSNLIERLPQNHGATPIEADDLPELDDRPSGVNFHLPASGIDFAELERELLTQALVMAGNNQTRAASLLGLSRDQLRYRLAKFDIAPNSAQG